MKITLPLASLVLLLASSFASAQSEGLVSTRNAQINEIIGRIETISKGKYVMSPFRLPVGAAADAESVQNLVDKLKVVTRETAGAQDGAIAVSDSQMISLLALEAMKRLVPSQPESAPATADQLTRAIEAPRAENVALRGLKDLPVLSGSAFDGAAAPAAASASVEPKKAGDWAVVLRFGPTLTDYSSTDIKVQTGRVNGVIKNATIGERNDMNWYSLKGIKERPFHFIDEPSNDFTIGLENRKKGYAVNFIARHPKFLVVEQDAINQNVRFTGTLDGAAVDRDMRANELFDHYRLTHKLMNYQVQVEKLFTIAEGKAGRLVVAPGIAAGAYFGYANAGYGDGSTGDAPVSNHYLGKGISGSGRVSYEFHRLSASVAYQLTKAAMQYPLIDGTASQRLDNRALTFQLGVAIKK